MRQAVAAAVPPAAGVLARAARGERWCRSARRIVLSGAAPPRHAQARTCRVRLWLDEAVCLEVRDDGGGLPASRHRGAGLLSMRERAAELGGTCQVAPAPPGGTRVLVRLPLDRGVAPPGPAPAAAGGPAAAR